MAKISITKTEQIPFRDENGVVMQMVQYWVTVTATQEEWETKEDVQKEVDSVLEDNLKQILSKDIIYQQKTKQLQYLFNLIKQKLPKEEVKKILWDLKKIK